MFEIVHTLTDWYDGPRKGIADYHGDPHLFESEWKDSKSTCVDGDHSIVDTFLLMPISPEIFSLALEDWAIWRRWRRAFDQKTATIDTHPALPKERNRHEELKQLLELRLTVDPAKALRKVAGFRVLNDAVCDGFGRRPMEVCWKDLA